MMQMVPEYSAMGLSYYEGYPQPMFGNYQPNCQAVNAVLI